MQKYLLTAVFLMATLYGFAQSQYAYVEIGAFMSAGTAKRHTPTSLQILLQFMAMSSQHSSQVLSNLTILLLIYIIQIV